MIFLVALALLAADGGSAASATAASTSTMFTVIRSLFRGQQECHRLHASAGGCPCKVTARMRLTSQPALLNRPEQWP